MSALRKQMLADMVLRGMALRTQQSYIESVVKFAKFYGRTLWGGVSVSTSPRCCAASRDDRDSGLPH
jgi:hypothetical protein